jgi:hypothetical protein
MANKDYPRTRIPRKLLGQWNGATQESENGRINKEQSLLHPATLEKEIRGAFPFEGGQA